MCGDCWPAYNYNVSDVQKRQDCFHSVFFYVPVFYYKIGMFLNKHCDWSNPVH